MLRLVKLSVVGLCVWGCCTSAWGAVEAGDRPAIQWRTTAGEQITGEQLAGKIVVVDFWATWCGPCMNELPHMLSLYQQTRDKGVVFVGVSLDTSSQKLESVVTDRNIPWPQVADFEGWDSATAKAWGVSSIPRVFILRPDGAVYWSGHPARIDKPLQQALEQFPPDNTSEQTKAQRTAAIESAQSAGDYLDAKDYAAALTAIMDIPMETLEDAKVRTKVGFLLRKVQVQAADDEGWITARQDNPEADAALTQLSDALHRVLTSDADDTAAAPSGPHPSVIAAKLEAAEAAHEAGDYAASCDKYNWLVRLAPDTEAGLAAADRLAQYEADPDIAASIRLEKAERDAKSTLDLARNYEKAGRADLAAEQYHKILDQFPDATRACQTARDALAKLE